MPDKNYFKNLLPKRPKDAHKGTFGNVLNIAGSGFYTGAAYFSSAAALRVGCGKSTLASTTSVLKAVSMLCPDVILMPVDESIHNTILPCAYSLIESNLGNYQVISLGCGLYTCKDTIQFFEKMINVLCKTQLPVVIDADGLNILSLLYSEETILDSEKGILTKPIKLELPSQKTPLPLCLPVNTILTPHPKELAKLMAVSVDNILLQPEFWAKKAAEKYNCTVVLKLHETIVADNKDNFYVNHTGNTALSHAGSGDVLCGMISGFLSQGGVNDSTCAKESTKDCRALNCFEASVLGVYLHGIAAELASKELSEYSTLSSDLLNYIPKAIKTLL